MAAVERVLGVTATIQQLLLDSSVDLDEDDVYQDLTPAFDDEVLNLFESYQGLNNNAIVQFEGADVGLDLGERLLLLKRIEEDRVCWWAPLDAASFEDSRLVRSLLQLNQIEVLGAECALSLDDDGQVLMLEGFVSMQTIRIDCGDAVEAILAKVDQLISAIDEIDEIEGTNPRRLDLNNLNYV